MSAKLSLFCLT